MRKIIYIISGSIIVLLALIFTGIHYYQSTRFNSNIRINGINVGGQTAVQALNKLKSSTSKNIIYVGQNKIIDEKDTKLGYTNQNLADIQKLLSRQKTFFPSSKAKNYTLVPDKKELSQSQTIEKRMEEKLTAMNQSRKAPVDAQVYLKQGSILVSKSLNGTQLDIASELKSYQKQEFNSVIHIQPVYIQPVKTDSPMIKKEEDMLKNLSQRTVTYKVQNEVYSLKASDLIKNASITKNMKYSIDTNDIKARISEIASSVSTLNKNFLFKTHSGSVISVKGQTYGWSLDIDKETERIAKAFEDGVNSLSAANIYGVGYSTYGIGYDTTANHGIGDTYAEVSIEDQRIWIYKNGKLAITTPVVTGRHDVHEDTPKGVWYIMYKQTPSILVGSEVGNPHYSIKVSYWAPFTLSGCGFHDASWRTNWASNAYLSQGSGGCVNTPPSAMKTVYSNLTQNEPVIIY
ncbi:L,D-transpeptidase family protein [Heyndrickxia acidicola]|uniref:L,D-transpeptidase family protein n=1 Tax=Heyndrickxia acidicola TaxID=209389 RepID=A0ABU6MM44_9BACI|nr:L,D-transpeptidase family protein [Heyndrickxia acidicola]MED1205759.1 L,D-transpeptidase family protein [Heyndrickxia acidicola]